MRERSHLQRLAALERDAALARAGRTRRWAVAGTVALTALFAWVVSAIAPGRSLGAKRSTVSAPATRASGATAPGTPATSAMPPLASPSQLGLQGPAQAPQPAPAQQSAPAPAQSAPAPAQQSAPAPAQPAPSDSGGGGAVVSGGS